MLNDLLGYYKRNVRKLNDYQVKKELNEIKQIQMLMEKELKYRSMRGAV